MERLKERIEVANKALSTLNVLVGLTSLNDIERDAMIQRFECSFEAAWKAIKRYLDVVEGLAASSPKSVIRASFETNLLNDSDTRQALAMVDDRNLTSHTYNEQLAKEITSRIPSHYKILEKWLIAAKNNVEKD